MQLFGETSGNIFWRSGRRLEAHSAIGGLVSLVDAGFQPGPKSFLPGFLAVLFFLGLTLLFPIQAQAQITSCPAGELPLDGSGTGMLDATHTSDIWCVALPEDNPFSVADE